jgi:hypothetical protein
MLAVFLVARMIVLPLDGLAFAGSTMIDGPVRNGSTVAVDLPDSQRVRDFGAPADRKGLCVFTTLDMCARYQNARP